MNNNNNLLSLFCGAGGLDLGFISEGFKVKLAIDYSAAAIQTHKLNFPSSNAQQHDLLALGADGLFELCKEHFILGQSIGIIGGPPCQGFSRSNRNSNTDDPRNKLAILYIDMIEKLYINYNVDFVVFENVMGLKDKKHQDTYQLIISRLKSFNFDVYEKELNAKDFGVAQIRKRVIIIALKKGSYKNEPEFVTSDKSKNVRDVIFNLPEPIFYKKNIKSDDIPYHPNHWTMMPRSKRFLDDSLMDNNKSRSFRSISWDKPSPTIAYGNREIHIHPDKKRRLSIFESMLLQGFPKKFVLQGNLSQQVTQISNAVPPPMARKIAQVIKNLSI